MCLTHDHAIRFYHGIIDFLDKRLDLEINTDKSGVINLKEKASEFLGFSIKAQPKGTARYGWIAYTKVCDKALERIRRDAVRKIRAMKCNSHTNEAIQKYNMYIMGVKNYYQYANNVTLDFNSLQLYRVIKNQLKNRGSVMRYCDTTKEYKSQNKGLSSQIMINTINDEPLHLITAVQCKNPMNFSQDMCLYTTAGRLKIGDKSDVIPNGYMSYILLSRYHNKDRVEYNDNRLSKYLYQNGKCYILGEQFHPREMHCHHKTPRHQNGDDSFVNLIWMNEIVHVLIHSTDQNTIDAYMSVLKLTNKQLIKVNTLRDLAGLSEILINNK